jgi:hypothetical protein
MIYFICILFTFFQSSIGSIKWKCDVPTNNTQEYFSSLEELFVKIKQYF